MQIIRRFNFVLIIHLFMVGCKKDIVASSKIDVKSNKAERINKNDKTFPKLEEIKHSPSLVISCGSGCAMTYNTKMITQNGLDIKVKFTVDLFINEELSDTYNETYIFSYNSLYKLKKITKESEGNEDFLETQSIDNQRSFRDFAKELIENKTDVSENCFKDILNVFLQKNKKEYKHFRYLVSENMFLDYFIKDNEKVNKNWGEKEENGYEYYIKGDVKNHLKSGHWEEKRYSFEYNRSVWLDGDYNNGIRDKEWNISPEGAVEKINLYKKGSIVKTFSP
ncbi:hypothetical protein [Chryseobacterium vrystaatense]|uniref:Uncharacterized protein n=1 Tax=Chryseobacterium vrystaatense TaxID=307480 RepID=A0A1M4W685_9FLAO|nr:hypothetical protein [Chryseobacterium vrystaatense]SHE76781.1 hypothetical protein SAMN02787073_1081 [Chryseobacterium vrystaatense]